MYDALTIDDHSIESDSETTLATTLKSAYRYAISLTGNKQDSEDLVQYASLKLIRKYGKILSRSLLFTTIRNLFVDQLRRKKVVSFAPIDLLPEPGLSVAHGAKSDIETALAALNPQEREAIYLNVVEGYTADEIGKRIGKSRGTILSRISRGRRKLKHLQQESQQKRY